MNSWYRTNSNSRHLMATAYIRDKAPSVDEFPNFLYNMQCVGRCVKNVTETATSICGNKDGFIFYKSKTLLSELMSEFGVNLTMFFINHDSKYVSNV